MLIHNIKKKYLFPLFIGLLISSFWGCKSSDSDRPQTAEEMYNAAIILFEDEDWEEANKLFEVIKLQYGATQFADDAQYHLAEINFKKGEFILAAYNYNSLRRTFPTSKFYKVALYKAGLCYYELSPTYDRDQEYTHKAIDIFQDYQRIYNGDSLWTEAGNIIDELRDKLAHREFFTAQLYRKLHSSKSALIYLDVVISDYPDTQYYEKAYYEKIDILAGTFRVDETKILIEKYKKLFPEGDNIQKVLFIEQQIFD